MKGSREKKIGNITIGCMDPEARDLLEIATKMWHDKHDKCGIPSLEGYDPYSAFYWLFRYSGLIEPSEEAKKLLTSNSDNKSRSDNQ
jgi:hypothetical protein